MSVEAENRGCLDAVSIEGPAGVAGGREAARIADWRGQWGSRRGGGESAAGDGAGGPRCGRDGAAETAQERAGENGAGVVAAGADDGLAALGEGGSGNGALPAGDAGRQPAGAQTRKEVGKTEATASTTGETSCLKTIGVIILGLSLPLFALTALCCGYFLTENAPNVS